MDDGYQDDAVAKLGGHRPAGPLRGGKYSAFEAGTRVPFLVRWPARVQPSVSDALVCQVDFPAAFAALADRKLADSDAPDSFNVLPTLLGESRRGRDHLMEQAAVLSLRQGPWKLIEPGKGPKVLANTSIESGQASEVQLYNLADDLRETTNVAAQHPGRVKEMRELLQKVRGDGRSRPAGSG